MTMDSRQVWMQPRTQSSLKPPPLKQLRSYSGRLLPVLKEPLQDSEPMTAYAKLLPIADAGAAFEGLHGADAGHWSAQNTACRHIQYHTHPIVDQYIAQRFASGRCQLYSLPAAGESGSWCILRTLNSIDAHPSLYDTPIVRGVIASKWHAFAWQHLRQEAVKFVVGFVLFLLYQVRVGQKQV
jgi:hypothetical protein